MSVDETQSQIENMETVTQHHKDQDTNSVQEMSVDGNQSQVAKVDQIGTSATNTEVAITTQSEHKEDNTTSNFQCCGKKGLWSQLIKDETPLCTQYCKSF